MDKIILNNLSFYGYHGVLKEEKRLGQKFLIDVVLYLNLQKAGQTDKIEHTVNYALLYEIIKRIATEENFSLIEALGEKICSEIMKTFDNILKIQIKIKKPEAPINGIFEYIAVEIERERKKEKGANQIEQ